MDSIAFSFDMIFKLDTATGKQSPGSSGCFDLLAGKACTPSF